MLVLCSDEFEGRQTSDPTQNGGHRSAGRSVSKILNKTIPKLLYTSSELQCNGTGCADLGSCLLLVAVSCGRKRSCCARELFVSPPFAARPYLRTKDLLLTSQTTNKQPPVHLPSLFGASRPSILRNWTPTACWAGPTLGGNGRRSQWPKKKCNARIRGRPRWV